MKLRRCIMAMAMVAVALMSATPSALAANPIKGLLERIDRGASSKFVIEIKPNTALTATADSQERLADSPATTTSAGALATVASEAAADSSDNPAGEDYFEVSAKGSKVLVRGNNYVSVAAGVNWYLNHVAHINLTWNCMTASLPEQLPLPEGTIRRSTNKLLRYDFNYCTYSYTMAFWDWARWEKEIDWMALHGINLPLAAVGQECVWRNMLTRLGYSKEDINSFISGPGFLAWWAMNNLEGWGGPMPDSWYTAQEALQKRILARMKEYGIHPVLPGYSGMMPSNADTRLGLNIIKSPLWNGFNRPAFLYPTDEQFARLAALYYSEQQKLFGKADYYSMDPFHECKNADDFDFAAGGRAVMAAMKAVNPAAMWVVQGWSENPRQQMIDALNPGDLLILDLFAECKPMWGIESPAKREGGFGNHRWLMCMIENFGGNVGLHGRMDELLDNYRQIASNPLGQNCLGIGLTMEGSENNPVMFELMTELPWLDRVPTKEEWLRDYVAARYGRYDETLYQAWLVLANSIYNAPMGNIQQGPHESIFCARPGLDNFQVSSWSKMRNYYDPTATARAAEMMLSVADNFRGCDNFEYDLVDVVRQAIADEGRRVYEQTIGAYKCFDRDAFEAGSARFMALLGLQDGLLSSRREFRVGEWIAKARNLGTTDVEKDLYEWNARVQVTTWGPRECADKGGLRDYAHKEWNGMLSDFYAPRWEAFWQSLRDVFAGQQLQPIDYYAMEEPWTLSHNHYDAAPLGNSIDIARDTFNQVFNRTPMAR